LTLWAWQLSRASRNRQICFRGWAAVNRSSCNQRDMRQQATQCILRIWATNVLWASFRTWQVLVSTHSRWTNASAEVCQSLLLKLFTRALKRATFLVWVERIIFSQCLRDRGDRAVVRMRLRHVTQSLSSVVRMWSTIAGRAAQARKFRFVSSSVEQRLRGECCALRYRCELALVLSQARHVRATCFARLALQTAASKDRRRSFSLLANSIEGGLVAQLLMACLQTWKASALTEGVRSWDTHAAREQALCQLLRLCLLSWARLLMEAGYESRSPGAAAEKNTRDSIGCGQGGHGRGPGSAAGAAGA